MPIKANIIDLELTIKRAGIKFSHPLESGWVLWRKYSHEKDMTAICRFNSAEGFTVFLNNMSFHKCVRYTIMKEGITPIWESIHHRNGGYFTIDMHKRLSHDDCKKISCDFLRGLIGGFLCEKDLLDNLTGITLVFDNETNQCRFWAKDRLKKIYFKDITKDYKKTIVDCFDLNNMNSSEIEFIHSSFVKISHKKVYQATDFHDNIIASQNKFADVDERDLDDRTGDIDRKSPVKKLTEQKSNDKKLTEQKSTEKKLKKLATNKAESNITQDEFSIEEQNDIKIIENSIQLKKSSDTEWLYIDLLGMKKILLSSK